MTKQIEQPIKYGKNDVEIISKRKLFNGFFKWLNINFVIAFRGGWSKEIRREVLNAAMLAWFTL